MALRLLGEVSHHMPFLVVWFLGHRAIWRLSGVGGTD